MKSAHRILNWYPRPPQPGCPYRHWLTDQGSLTRRIQARCDAFSVRHVTQHFGKSTRDEAARTGLQPRQYALLREVFLYCGENPVVFAHSVLPKASLRGAWYGLGSLGNKPLGAALFSTPRIKRAPLEFKKLSPRHPLYHRACRVLPHKPAHLWARRSVFRLHNKPILVTEVFLPGILEL